MGTEHGFTRWERPHSPSERPSSAPHVTLILLPRPHTAGQGDSRSQGGDSQALASAGQELLEEPSQSKVSQSRPGCDSVSGVLVQGQLCSASTGSCATRARSALPQAGRRSRPCPSPEVQRALARAQRQRLRAQHCRQLQRELGASTVPAQEHSGEVSTAPPLRALLSLVQPEGAGTPWSCPDLVPVPNSGTRSAGSRR